MARILIAEDDPVSQIQVFNIVEKLGHVPFVSPNGLHAWQALKASNSFDLLISDLVMPEMDGRQLIKTMRDSSRFIDFPVIIISAVIGISEINDILELGASSFLGKPVRMTELNEYLKRLLKLNGKK